MSQINELETELAEIKGIKDKLHRFCQPKIDTLSSLAFKNVSWSLLLVGMCESWSSRMMTLRGQKEAPWPGSELFSIDTYPLLIYGSRKIFPNWNILSLEDFEGRMNAAIERNAFLESELDEKVGGKKDVHF